MQLTTEIFLIVLAFIGFLCVREFLKYRGREAQREYTKQQKESEKINFSQIFDNLPTILAQLEKLYAEQRAAGADEKTLKPLQERINQVKWAQQNEWWLKPFAPYGDKLAKSALKMLDGFL